MRLPCIGEGLTFYSLGSIRYNTYSGTYETVQSAGNLWPAAAAVLVTLLIDGLISISIFAFANLIGLLVDTEVNTRYTAVALKYLANQLGSLKNNWV